MNFLTNRCRPLHWTNVERDIPLIVVIFAQKIFRINQHFLICTNQWTDCVIKLQSRDSHGGRDVPMLSISNLC